MTGLIISTMGGVFLFVLVCVLTYRHMGDGERIKLLTDLLDDSDATITALEQQALMLGEQCRDFADMKVQQDIIALHLRDSCKRQIAAGLHAGRGIGEIVVAYLSGRMPGADVLAGITPALVKVPRNIEHLITGKCTRGTGHDGPCNGAAVEGCPVAIKTCVDCEGTGVIPARTDHAQALIDAVLEDI